MAINRSIKLTGKQWTLLKIRLEKDYPLSILIIRGRMKRELGFTTRESYSFDNNRYAKIIHLDFFDDAKKTFFLLKYSDYLESR